MLLQVLWEEAACSTSAWLRMATNISVSASLTLALSLSFPESPWKKLVCLIVPAALNSRRQKPMQLHPTLQKSRFCTSLGFRRNGAKQSGRVIDVSSEGYWQTWSRNDLTQNTWAPGPSEVLRRTSSSFRRGSLAMASAKAWAPSAPRRKVASLVRLLRNRLASAAIANPYA